MTDPQTRAKECGAPHGGIIIVKGTDPEHGPGHHIYWQANNPNAVIHQSTHTDRTTALQRAKEYANRWDGVGWYASERTRGIHKGTWKVHAWGQYA